MLYEDDNETTVVKRKPSPAPAVDQSAEIKALGKAILEVIKSHEMPDQITEWEAEVTERDNDRCIRKIRFTAIQ